MTVFNSSGSAAGYGWTDAAGGYTVTGLTPGAYTVEFVPPTASGVNAVPQYYNGKTAAASADPVTVAGGRFATVNTDLPTGGQITGAVTDASTHAGLAGVEVYAYSASGGYSGYAYTDANGNYTISSLATGTYQVLFSPSTTRTSARDRAGCRSPPAPPPPRSTRPLPRAGRSLEPSPTPSAATP